jgi:plasmid maintenance system antidote protein VapI
MTDTIPDAGTPPAEPEGGQKTTSPTTGEDEKRLTQAEVDAIVQDRLKRDRKAREEKLAEELGVSLKEAKEIIVARRKQAEDEKTELQKATAKAAELEAKLKLREISDLKRSKIEKLIAEKKIQLPNGVSISDVLRTVSGESEDEIEEGASLLPRLFPPSMQVGGAGSNPANPPGKPPDLDTQIKEAELIAMRSGDPLAWKKVTALKIKKQGL